MQNESEITRAFIAIEVPENVKARLAEIQRDFKKRMGSASWTRLQGFHITLKFLGNIDGAQIDALKKALAEPFAQPAFKVAIERTGIFPSPQKARVLWAGVGTGEDGLHALYSEVEERAAAVGFEREKRPYTGHLTLARFRNPCMIMPALLEMRLDCPEFVADRVVLFKSELNPAGSIYTPLAARDLRPSNA